MTLFEETHGVNGDQEEQQGDHQQGEHAFGGHCKILIEKRLGLISPTA